MIKKSTLQQRLRQLQKKLLKARIKFFFINNPSNVRYFTNYNGSNGQLLVAQQKAYFITDFRYKGLAQNILPPAIHLRIADKGLISTLKELTQKEKIRQLYFEENNLSYAYYSALKRKIPEIGLKPSSDLCASLRMVKDKDELSYIKKAQAIAEKVFLKVKKELKVGKSELEVAWEIEKYGHVYGADSISFPPIVGFGANSAIPHHQNSKRRLKRGDVVLIDMGMQYQGYCSDMTRMIFTQKPTDFQKKIYNLVLEAQEKSIRAIKTDVIGKDIDEHARSIIRKAGYGETFGHSLGHGIGLEVHESPNLSQGYEKSIPENTIVTVEPGIYLENSFGVRIEDMVLVKSNKAVNITKIPKKIEESLRLL